MIKVQHQDSVQMEQLQITPNEFTSQAPQQVSTFHNKLKIQREENRKTKKIPNSSIKKWIFPVIFVLLAAAIVAIFLVEAKGNEVKKLILGEDKGTSKTINSKKNDKIADQQASIIQQLDKQVTTQSNKPQDKKQEDKDQQKKKQQTKREVNGKQQIGKQQAIPIVEPEVIQIKQEPTQKIDRTSTNTDKKSQQPNPSSEQYEYDVNGTFSLWDLNPMAKSILFETYSSLANDKKIKNNKYMDISYGKDEYFNAFAKNFEANIDLIDWFALNLTTEEKTMISKDFQEALNKRRKKMEQLLIKYQEEYAGKTGPIDQKKNVTYQRFLSSLEYQKLTGQKIKQKDQLKKIYEKQKQYYRQTYRIDRPKQEIHNCIVIPTYNNVVDHRYLWNLESILQQQYSKYKLIIIDDASSDQTAQKIAKHLKWRGVSSEKAVLLRSKKHQTALPNIYYGLHRYCDYNQIFYILDGDDQIIGTQVFKLYNALYQQKKYYVIYSSHFQYESKNTTHSLPLGLPFAYPEQIKQANTYRTYAHAYSQLRTAMTDVFLLINIKSLKGDDGNFYWTISDNALFFSAMEMSCGRVEYIPELEYWYNANTGINDWRTTDQTNYGRAKRHINFVQKHYQCIHKTIRQIEAALNSAL